MAQELTGQVAIVTGAGRGIGRAIAEALAAAGASVSIVAWTTDQLQETATAISKSGGRALVTTADVTDASAITRAVVETEHALLRGVGVWWEL